MRQGQRTSESDNAGLQLIFGLVTDLLLHMEDLAVFWDALDLVLGHGA